ncbi:aminopeptidase [Deinococcus sp. Marseille-Q6407]|uniref:aminopeptidase n=1 Tax=Deinococcus sp. Marseille-Q6407 TaxID=2969223 RepID=UPI0021BF0CDA|nr:aminopeptidase [Deinococcus sp. Marseille-Q6407]
MPTFLPYDPAKHAELLVDYCLYAQLGERLQLASSTLALPLMQELYRTVLRRGARPVMQLEYPGQLDDFAALAADDVLDQVHQGELLSMEQMDGTLRVKAPEAPLAGDPKRHARLVASGAQLAAVRSQKKWSLTLYPTEFAAEQANMPLPEFEDFVMRAMFLDRADPVAAWGEIREMQAGLIERLRRADQFRIQNAGTDLTFSVRGRTWSNSDGRRNMPSGEVFTGPIEDTANGYVTFSVPTIYGGQWVRGARLEFRDGLVVDARADEGEDVLLAALDTDPGARRLGEIGIGSNFGIQRPTGNILFDEKMGGTVHLALGRSYPETGGLNESGIHWDLITDLRPAAGGGTVSLDGEVWQRDGQFV